MQDEYNPSTVKRERTGATRTMSGSTKSSTVKEDSLFAILNRLGVRFKAKEVVPIFGEFDGYNRPVSLIPDALVHDKNYGSGVFEVDGSSHKTRGAAKWDDRKDAYYAKMGLWVERIANRDVNESNVRAILVKHYRVVDAYGGALGGDASGK